MGGIFGSTVLDVAIGLAFVYLLLGLFCTTVNEWISGILKTRSKLLEEAIRRLLAGQSLETGRLVDQFYKHPVITGMMRGGAHPSYLAARSFAVAVMDLVTPAVQGPLTFQDLVGGIAALPDGDLKKALLALSANAQGNLQTAQKNIEAWFDDSMDRVSGWYKRTAQRWTIAVAVIITVMANADTLNIAHRLWTDPALRATVVEQARQRAQQPRPSVTVQYTDKNDPLKPTVTPVPGDPVAGDSRKALGQMMGWTKESWHLDAAGWLERIIGWIFTAIAVSLGAPFWYDSLSRFVNIRNAGRVPPEAKKEAA